MPLGMTSAFALCPQRPSSRIRLSVYVPYRPSKLKLNHRFRASLLRESTSSKFGGLSSFCTTIRNARVVTDETLTRRRAGLFLVCMDRHVVGVRTRLQLSDVTLVILSSAVAFLAVFLWFLWR